MYAEALTIQVNLMSDLAELDRVEMPLVMSMEQDAAVMEVFKALMLVVFK